MNNRIATISNLRIIGILLVVFGHSYPFNVEIPSALIDIRSFIYLFHMPLFIFISAYLVAKTHSIERHDDYLKDRAIKMLMPYVVLTMIFYIPKTLLANYINDSVELNFMGIVETFLVPRNNVWGHFWFLPVIFIMAVVSVGFNKLIKKSKYISVLICILTAVFLFLPNVTDWFGFDDVKNNLFWYLLGMLCGSISKEQRTSALIGVLALIIGITGFFVIPYGYAKLFVAIFMIIGLVNICAKFDMTTIRLFKEIEHYSFSIFIMSWPFQAVIEVVANKLLALPFYVVMPMMIFGGGGTASGCGKNSCSDNKKWLYRQIYKSINRIGQLINILMNRRISIV